MSNEIERLRAFVHSVAEFSTCPATVLVARQVLEGHDVRPNPRKNFCMHLPHQLGRNPMECAKCGVGLEQVITWKARNITKEGEKE